MDLAGHLPQRPSLPFGSTDHGPRGREPALVHLRLTCGGRGCRLPGNPSPSWLHQLLRPDAAGVPERP